MWRYFFLYKTFKITNMTDKQFTALMKKTQEAGLKHKKFLSELEEEYFRRYGQYPSDIDDDFFIDAFDYCQCDLPTLDQVHESATLFL